MQKTLVAFSILLSLGMSWVGLQIGFERDRTLALAFIEGSVVTLFFACWYLFSTRRPSDPISTA
jgi:hypothetical protein